MASLGAICANYFLGYCFKPLIITTDTCPYEHPINMEFYSFHCAIKNQAISLHFYILNQDIILIFILCYWRPLKEMGEQFDLKF